MLKEFPFPVQRIQTDRGTEFFAYNFQDELRKHKVKFRPIRPLSPHLNGKVERSQLTEPMEFWSAPAVIALTDRIETAAEGASVTKDLTQRLTEWQGDYNEQRTHGALNGKTPQNRFEELKDKVPTVEQVADSYQTQDEPDRAVDFSLDQRFFALRKVKRSR